MRELEQCVRSILIHGVYRPAQAQQHSDVRQQFAASILQGQLTNAQILGRYYALVYAQTSGYEASAQILNTNWRTIKANMDMAFLAQLKGTA
jgi:hypothetical protein